MVYLTKIFTPGVRRVVFCDVSGLDGDYALLRVGKGFGGVPGFGLSRVIEGKEIPLIEYVQANPLHLTLSLEDLAFLEVNPLTPGEKEVLRVQLPDRLEPVYAGDFVCKA